jgi:hypothetical protein
MAMHQNIDRKTTKETTSGRNMHQNLDMISSNIRGLRRDHKPELRHDPQQQQRP